MKRVKKVYLEKKEKKIYFVIYKCPHCKTEVHDHTYDSKIIRWLCPHCKNPLESMSNPE